MDMIITEPIAQVDREWFLGLGPYIKPAQSCPGIDRETIISVWCEILDPDRDLSLLIFILVDSDIFIP